MRRDRRKNLPASSFQVLKAFSAVCLLPGSLAPLATKEDFAKHCSGAGNLAAVEALRVSEMRCAVRGTCAFPAPSTGYFFSYCFEDSCRHADAARSCWKQRRSSCLSKSASFRTQVVCSVRAQRRTFYGVNVHPQWYRPEALPPPSSPCARRLGGARLEVTPLQRAGGSQQCTTN